MSIRHRLARLPIPLYRAGLGRLLGHRFVMIEHRGRRSGRTRAVVVQVVRWDAAARRVIVISGYGPRSDWYRNVLAEPRVRVSIAGERGAPGTARPLTADETAAELRATRERHPLATRMLGMVLGEDFNGKIDASLAARLPGVAIALAAPRR